MGHKAGYRFKLILYAIWQQLAVIRENGYALFYSWLIAQLLTSQSHAIFIQ